MPHIPPEEELEEFRYIGKNCKEEGIKLPESIEKQILPFCIKEKCLVW